MFRPTPLPQIWQAIAAFVGLFTLVSASADPVDLWRITVQSYRGQPLKAVATLEKLPEERITEECLSLGPQSDAPGADAPFLQQARLKLNSAGTAVEITTDAPISSPALELVLRVQCPGAFFYARHFSILIPPAPRTAATTVPGFRLKVGSGETLQSLAASLLPGNPALQRQLVQEVITRNPNLFPDGKSHAVPAGTILLFPELRAFAARSRAQPSSPPGRAALPASPGEAPVATPKRRKRAASPPEQAGEPITLRRALELGDRPGPQECKLLLPLCGMTEAAPSAPLPDPRAGGLESGMQALRLKQDSIDGQLARLEQSLQALQKAVESRPATDPASPAPPPKPEIRTVVKTEYKTAPIPWYFWAGVALAALIAATAGFLFGRRQGFAGSLEDSDQRLDRMLASAASEIREMENEPPPPPPRPAGLPRAMPPATTEPPDPEPESARGAGVPDIAFDTQMTEASNIDVELDSGAADAPAQDQGAVSADLAFEMDQALDNTRSMFTDVDRFIALGRTQNALSLLQFQVHKDPKDRDSWIKLLAIYRQEKMDIDLDKALREFRKNFPNDKATI